MGLGRLCDDDQDPEDKRVRAELRRTLVAGSTSERAFALMSLSEAAARRGSGAEPGSALTECREALLEELARGKSRSRSWAALALGVLEFRLQEQGVEPAQAVREALRRAFANAAGPDESGACAVGLGLSGDAEGASALGERLAGPGDDILHGYFALGIGVSGKRALAEGVRTVSAGARYRPFLLQQCAIALALLGDKNLAPDLTSELRTATGQASQSWLAQALGMVGDARTVPVLVGMVRDHVLTDSARGNLTSALGIVCDKDDLPWYHALSSRVNWRAVTSTLIAGNGTGGLVHVEGFGRQGFEPRVVARAPGEAGQLGGQALLEPAELGHRPAVVVEALEFDDLDALDALPGGVVLSGVALLGVGGELRHGLGSGGLASSRR